MNLTMNPTTGQQKKHGLRSTFVAVLGTLSSEPGGSPPTSLQISRNATYANPNSLLPDPLERGCPAWITLTSHSPRDDYLPDANFAPPKRIAAVVSATDPHIHPADTTEAMATGS